MIRKSKEEVVEIIKNAVKQKFNPDNASVSEMFLAPYDEISSVALTFANIPHKLISEVEAYSPINDDRIRRIYQFFEIYVDNIIFYAEFSIDYNVFEDSFYIEGFKLENVSTVYEMKDELSLFKRNFEAHADCETDQHKTLWHLIKRNELNKFYLT